MGVRKRIQIIYLLIGFLALDVGRSEKDEHATWHRQQNPSYYRTEENLENSTVALQTSEGRRQVTIKAGMTWVRETATWEMKDEEFLPDHVLQEITDGSLSIALILDGHGRLRECQLSHDQDIAKQFVLDMKKDHTFCAHVADELKTKEDGSRLLTQLFPTSSKNLSAISPPQCRRFSNAHLPSHLINITSVMNDCQKLLASMAPHSNLISTDLTQGNSFIYLHHRGHRRTRRSIMYPGTLWCGAGTRAKSEYALGENTFTDRCCRAHDFCPQDMQILSFKTKYYFTNQNMFTLSHCACDKRFHKCLRQVRNTVSFGVGNWYFNILNSKCFVVRQKKQCVEKGWWGKCNRYEKRPTALLRQTRPFPKSLERNKSGKKKKEPVE